LQKLNKSMTDKAWQGDKKQFGQRQVDENIKFGHRQIDENIKF